MTKCTPLFSILLAITVLVYHLSNQMGGVPFHLPFRWTSQTALVKMGQRSVASFALTSSKLIDKYFIDDSSKSLAELGYAFRYRVGQNRPGLLYGNAEPYLNLYLKDEIPFQAEMSEASVQEGYVDKLTPFRRALEAHGVKLLLVPVPTKLSIQRDPVSGAVGHFWSTQAVESSVIETPERPYRALVESERGNVIDLFSIYRRYREDHPGANLYVPMDMYWSSLGVALAGKNIAESVAKAGAVILRRTKYGPVPYTHGMVGGLNLSENFVNTHPEFRWREPMYDLVAHGIKTDIKRIFQLGTCYSSRFKETKYGLGNLLSRVLKAPVYDFAAPGSHGILAALGLRNSGVKLGPGDLVVLEFAFRQPWAKEDVIVLPHFAKNANSLP